MADKTLTVNGQPFTFNRDKFAGVRTMTVNGETVTVDRTAPVIDSDRAGESRPLLSKVVGGAAAAYSLRDLNDKAGNNKVVRVRRESDNNERDFLAKEVSNGTLQNWVNSQATLPLDLQTLTADGRTGSVIGAQAAYSLRNLSKNYTGNVVEVRRNTDGAIRNFTATEIADGSTIENWVNTSFTSSLPLDISPAQAAYSLRSLSSTYSGAVVNVRRSSDDTTRDFTADSITNGTLEAFVNENQVHYASDYSSGLDGWEIVTNNWTGSASWSHNGTNDNRLAVTATATPSGVKRPAIKLTRPSNILVGQQYSLELDYEVISGTPVLLGNNFDGADYSHNETLSGSGTATIAPAAFNAGTPFIYFDGENHTFELSIKAIRFKSTVANGFVNTWYDQSGNNNHARQSQYTKQPKIVENGSLTKDNDKVGIDFDDDSENFLAATSVSGLEEKLSVFSASVRDSNGYVVSLSNSSHNAKYFGIQEANSSSEVVPRNTAFGASVQPSVSGNTRLTFGLTTGETSTSAGALGGTLVTGTNDYGNNFVSGDLNQIAIGVLRTVSPSASHYFEGRIREIIVYAGSANGDQTEKRRAIEESIATNYSITLASFNRDGTVNTWYDQSGNGRHLVQSTYTKQPKIVHQGALVTLSGKPTIKPDGVDDFLINTTSAWDTITNTALSCFTLAEKSSVTNDQLWATGSSTDNDGDWLIGGAGTSGNVQYRGARINSNVVSTATSGTMLLSSFDVTGGDAFINGTSMGASNNNAGASATADRLVLFARRAGDSNTNQSISEAIFYGDDQTDNRTAFEANIAEHYGISEIPTATDTVNGFVEALYDQSGNGKDAIQATATNQPKIVDTGSLVPLGMDFTGGKFLPFSSISAKTVIAVNQLTNTNNLSYLVARQAGDGGVRTGAGNGLFQGADCPTSQSADFNNAGGTTHLNGSQSSFLATNANVYFGTATSGFNFTAIGTGFTFSNQSRSWKGKIAEVIIYTTDQSLNRPAIEANLANQYGITLS